MAEIGSVSQKRGVLADRGIERVTVAVLARGRVGHRAGARVEVVLVGVARLRDRTPELIRPI